MCIRRRKMEPLLENVRMWSDCLQRAVMVYAWREETIFDGIAFRYGVPTCTPWMGNYISLV